MRSAKAGGSWVRICPVSCKPKLEETGIRSGCNFFLEFFPVFFWIFFLFFCGDWLNLLFATF